MKTTLPSRPRRRRLAPRKPGFWSDSATQVNVHMAKTHLSRLLARVENGEQITIARDGRAVALVSPVQPARRKAIPSDDPLLNLDKYGFNGPGGTLTNEEIDRIVYGI